MVYFGTKNGTSYGFYLDTSGFVDNKYKEFDNATHIKIINDANNNGKIIKADNDGNPILVDPPAPSEEELKQQRIDELQSYLSSTDWYAIRYADTGELIPAEIKEKRQNARNEISLLRD